MHAPIHVCARTKRPADDEENTTTNHQQKRSKNVSVSSPRALCLKQHENSAIEGSDIQTENRDATNKPLSALESLPSELIEKIFVYCLNVNLPRASPYLAAAVSNERVYRLLILLACWDDTGLPPNELSFTPLRNKVGGDTTEYEDLGTYPWRQNRMYSVSWILRPLGHDYVPFTPDERWALQWDIIGCKWCTNDRIRRQSPDLARLIITRSCVELGYMFEEEEQGRQLERLLQFEGEARAPRVFMTRRITKHPERKKWVNKNTMDDLSYCQITVKKDRFVFFSFARTLNRALYQPAVAIGFPLVNLRAIPPFLLRANIDSGYKGLVRGCFTDAHLAFLNNICQWGALGAYRTNLEGISYSGNALQQGVHVALSTINPRALDILLKCDSRFCRQPGFYYSIPSDHFRTAAQMYINMNANHGISDEHRDNVSNEKNKDDVLLCFCLLVTSSAESVPYDDPLITQFAMEVGGAFGKWLLDLMVALPKHIAKLEKPGDIIREDCIFYWRGPSLNQMGTRYLINVEGSGELFKIPRRLMSEENVSEPWK